MSFGFSASDFVLLVQLAHRTFRNCQKAGEEYVEIACQVRCLRSVLRTLRTEAQSPESRIFKQDPASTKQLLATAEGCNNVLGGLGFLLEKYEGLKPDGQASGGMKFWQRLRFGSKAEELGVIRGKLVTYTSMISVLIDTMQIQAVDRVETKIDAGFTEMTGQFAKMRRDIYTIASEHRAEERLGVGMSTLSLSTFAADDKVVWKDFRRQLLRRGYTSQGLALHKDLLISYMLKLDESGLLDHAQSGQTPPVINGYKWDTQRPIDLTEPLAKGQAVGPLMEEEMDSENEKLTPVECDLIPENQDIFSSTRNDDSPGELLQDHGNNNSGSCDGLDLSDDTKPRVKPQGQLKLDPEYHDDRGLSLQARDNAKINESQNHLKAPENILHIPLTQARYTCFHLSIVSPAVLATLGEAYTEVEHLLCVHRVLSRAEIEDCISRTATQRGLSPKAILSHLFPRNHSIMPPDRTPPFPLFTIVSREAVSVRVLQAHNKDYIADSEETVILGSLDNDELAYYIQRTKAVRGE
ncbi:hypothetical protein BKA65DRAFT_143030 [Rhexocercosporidium sp. MPI-PUGE-AT-0058]|nr:hypothetical protein BKA65DRAFT_143030 [Rhexocercosporidium sp. MPI-PUGE-AT-0058]